MLKRLIAHQILKEQSKTDTSLNLRRSVLPSDAPLADQLLDQLRGSFQTRNPLAGVFSAAPPVKTRPAFREHLLRYLSSGGDGAFVDFTTAVTEILAAHMASQPLATGGYVVFAEYEVNPDLFLMSALLSTLARPSFDASLDLIASNPLDFEHLRHAARIRLAGVDANDEGVVQFFSQRADGVSDYFVHFLGCDAVVRPDVQGRRLITAFNAIKVSPQVRKKLMEAASSISEEARREQRPMTLTEIASAAGPRMAEAVLSQLGREEYGLAGEFPAPPRSVMNQLRRFAYRDEGLRLEFDLDPWVNRVKVDRKKATVTISPAPAGLIDALERRA